MDLRLHWQTAPFQVPSWLRSPHAQTVLGGVLVPELQLPTGEVRHVKSGQDAELVCHCHWQLPRRRALTAVITHGVEGSAGSSHVLAMANIAWRAGMNVIRMNMRTCEGTEHLAPYIYHSGLYEDLWSVIEHFSANDRLDRFCVMAYSAGGNMALNFAAQQSPMPQLQSVVVISPATDIEAATRSLSTPKNGMYNAFFTRGLKNRYRKLCELYPDKFNIRMLDKVNTLLEYDQYLTAPYHGFRSAGDLYASASSAHRLDRIAIPTLIISAKDDPFVPLTNEARRRIARNPWITFCEMENGGHCGFLAEPDADQRTAAYTKQKFVPRLLRWAEREAVRFAFAVDHSRVEIEGMLKARVQAEQFAEQKVA